MSASEYKSAKDALVASLFELSKAANEVSKNAIDFFNISQLESNEPVNTAAIKVIEDEIIADEESVAATTAAAAAVAEAAAVVQSTEDKSTSSKKKRDPNAPKKPLTTYILYSNDIRSKIQAEHKEWPQTDIAKEISRLWISLDSDKKAAYKTIYEKDKERYLAEMQKYEEAKKNGVDYIAPSVLEYQEATKHKKEIAKAKAAEKKDRESEPPIESPKKSKKRSSAEEIATEDGDKKKKKKKSKKTPTISLD